MLIVGGALVPVFIVCLLCAPARAHGGLWYARARTHDVFVVRSCPMFMISLWYARVRARAVFAACGTLVPVVCGVIVPVLVVCLRCVCARANDLLVVRSSPCSFVI